MFVNLESAIRSTVWAFALAEVAWLGFHLVCPLAGCYLWAPSFYLDAYASCGLDYWVWPGAAWCGSYARTLLLGLGLGLGLGPAPAAASVPITTSSQVIQSGDIISSSSLTASVTIEGWAAEMCARLAVATVPSTTAPQAIQSGAPVASGALTAEVKAGDRNAEMQSRPVASATVDEKGRAMEASEKVRGDAVLKDQTDRDRLCGEASYTGLFKRGELERMARRRFQDPEPKREGRWWYLIYWRDVIENGRRRRIRTRDKLGPATMPQREAKKLAAELLRPMNQGLESFGSATLFMTFVNDAYRAGVVPTLAASTKERYESVLRNHLLPTFGGVALRDITPAAVQRYFAGFAQRSLQHESVDKIRDVLSAILGEAIRCGMLTKNPVEGVRLPKPKQRRAAKHYLTPEEFTKLVTELPEPYATMVFTAGLTGLRPSELIGLHWNDLGEDCIRVDERYYRGDWSEPKSNASAATIPVGREVIERLHRLKLLTVRVKAGRATRHYRVVKSHGPADLVFQSLEDGLPMRDNNVLTRHIKPAARKLGLDWVNWQVLRRSYATWLKISGADPKDAQALMRHSRVATTLEIYQQHTPASQHRAVENMGRLMQPSSTVN
ncbi:tyrosine-type recombinase/integrase [Paludibaculum fermentans]|uniref:tyrosine-type recombinase/integrase n=1 Tax=Paludibaculum fermentans TaxID=1473598 RepID=UPI003EB94C97